MIIRRYKPDDRHVIEEIHLKAGLAAREMEKNPANKKYYSGDLRYYLDKEPQSCYVAEDDGKIVGYLVGCLSYSSHYDNILTFLKTCLIKLLTYPYLTKKDRFFWMSRIKTVFFIVIGKSGELRFKTPKNSGHLHINLLKEARGKGIGSRLLKEFFRYAKANGVKKIHADSYKTSLNPNSNFWLKNGFVEYSRIKTLIFKDYYPNEDVYFVCYVKKL